MKSIVRAGLGACAALAFGFASRGIAADTPVPPAPTVPVLGGCAAPGCATPARGCTTGKCGASNCGLCGIKPYPLFEKRYIQQFCQPSIAPGGCFGHFKTQWTPWPVACPNWEESSLPPATLNWGPPARNAIPDPLPSAPTRIPPAKPTVDPAAPAQPPTTIPKPKEAPLKDAPRPPVPSLPTPKGSAPETPGKLNERGLVLPPVPEIPVGTPARF